jgi:hypothetical protein
MFHQQSGNVALAPADILRSRARPSIHQFGRVGGHDYSRTYSGNLCDSLAPELATPNTDYRDKFTPSITSETSTTQHPSQMVTGVGDRDLFASASSGVTTEIATPGAVHGVELALQTDPPPLVMHGKPQLVARVTPTGLSLEQSNDHETSNFHIKPTECDILDLVKSINSENASLTSPHPTEDLTVANCVHGAAQQISSTHSEGFVITKVNKLHDVEDAEDPSYSIQAGEWLKHHRSILSVSGVSTRVL